MGKHILLLGGGPGGLEAAHTLRRDLTSEHRITLVDKQSLFTMGFTKGWLLTGDMEAGENSGDRRQLAKLGINFLQGEVNSIDVAEREVQVGTERLHYDYLIIALGADLSPESTEGFTRYAKNLYTEGGVSEIREELQRVNTGTITILICGMPFKCPAGPYELAFLMDDMLRRRGVRDKISMQMVTPEPFPIPGLPPEGGKPVRELLQQRGIDYHPSHQVKEIRRNGVLTEDEKEFPHDLVFAVPVHVAPEVLKRSGLVDQSGWVPVDPVRMTTKAPNVYALGDCAGTKIPKGLPLPKLGTVARGQARIVAENIIGEIRGEAERGEFEGHGACFIEAGDGKVAIIRTKFYARPDPEWEYAPPSAEGMQEKHRYLQDRMNAWFPL